MPKIELPPGHWMGAPYMTEFQGPWSKTYAMNLTPDVNTGIGIWTEEMFLRAIREGRHMGQSRPIPAIHNRVPEYEPPSDPKED